MTGIFSPELPYLKIHPIFIKISHRATKDLCMPTPKITRRRLFTLLAGSTLCAGASLTNALLIEPDWLSLTEKEIPLPNLPASLDGLRVVHLADFHFRPDDDDVLITEMVKKVNDLDPDLIVLTGDYITSNSVVIPPLLGHLAKLRAKHGVIAIMGNHDGWNMEGRDLKRSFEKVGITFLINENTRLNIQGDTLAIAGLDFIWLGHPDADRAFRGIATRTPTLALVHEPDYFDHLNSEKNFLLQLSGHTHGGQCRVPLIGYAPVKVRYGEKYIYGIYDSNQSGDAKIHVTRGIGTTGIRVRFACRPEIALLTLRSIA